MNHRKFFLVTVLLCACVTNAAYAAELITLRYGQNETLVRIVRGFAASYQFMNDPKNHGEVLNIVKESLQISDENARQIFAPYTEPNKNVLPRRGELDLKAFDRVIALMGEAGVIPTPVAPAARFVDLQYLKSAGIQ